METRRPPFAAAAARPGPEAGAPAHWAASARAASDGSASTFAAGAPAKTTVPPAPRNSSRSFSVDARTVSIGGTMTIV